MSPTAYTATVTSGANPTCNPFAFTVPQADANHPATPSRPYRTRAAASPSTPGTSS